MDNIKKKGQLNNHVTRFGRFTWGEDERLRKALEEVKKRLPETTTSN